MNDLVKHATTVKHKKNATVLQKQPSVRNVFPARSDKISRTEIRLALHVACHSAIRSVDHLSEITNYAIASTSTAARQEGLRLHRTKCSALIKKSYFSFIFERSRN